MAGSAGQASPCRLRKRTKRLATARGKRPLRSDFFLISADVDEEPFYIHGEIVQATK
ncbi:hypothetical protein [Planococcus lenghuensis]|uniref:hypothetical protein n=1 Tax=Planococcus lenghuensis TaxID=2213202 RepID=UPI0012ECB073|nr:hypothetical protein [Planococcus lenghuensis]